MPVNWEDFLHIAEYLNQMLSSPSFTEESLKRNVISRAYYSAFCCVRNYAISNYSYPRRVKNCNEHSRLTDFLQHSSFLTAKRALLSMRNCRNKADYQDTINSDIKIMASDSLVQAKIIIEMIKTNSLR